MYVDILLFLLCIPCTVALQDQGKPKRNVLFLVADDMRPNLGAYYESKSSSTDSRPMHTPHLDSLAQRSLLLKRAYCQQSLCSPSRTSFLTGRRPDTTHVYNLSKNFRNVGGNFTTIPQYFKQHGYHSVSLGKIFHPGTASNMSDDPMSWSERYWHPPSKSFWHDKSSAWVASPKEKRMIQELPDTQLANKAIEKLQQLAPGAKSGNQPFFLAVGFYKPHLQFLFPEEMLEFYPRESIKLPSNPYAPVHMPKPAWNHYSELLSYENMRKLHLPGNINSTIPSNEAIDLRRAYYCTITFVDIQLGRVLQELRDLDLEKNTIVSFLGDHGWHLGEHGEWCKLTNFETANRSPMMIHIPGLTDNGIVTNELTELVDLFPTLVEAAELPPIPLCPENSSSVKLCREGRSLLPLIKDPHSSNWKDRVFSQYPRRFDQNNLMGYSMKTDRYRYTEWVKFNHATYQPIWDCNRGTELYDHLKDPQENWNRAYDSDYQDICQHLSKQLHAGWRGVAI